MHGGGIVVESRVGAGSRFSVSLPRDPRLVAGSPAAERADVASVAAAGTRNGRLVEPAHPANMQETSPSERTQVNTEAAG
jgi:hypothetical protein